MQKKRGSESILGTIESGDLGYLAYEPDGSTTAVYALVNGTHGSASSKLLIPPPSMTPFDLTLS